MLAYQILFGLLALSIPAVGFVVLVRLLLAAYRALRASRWPLAGLSLLGVACIAALFVVVAAVWFAYAVSHSKKDVWRDLELTLLTVLPFHAASYGLWRMGGHVESLLGVDRAPATSAGAEPPPPPATG